MDKRYVVGSISTGNEIGGCPGGKAIRSLAHCLSTKVDWGAVVLRRHRQRVSGSHGCQIRPFLLGFKFQARPDRRGCDHNHSLDNDWPAHGHTHRSCSLRRSVRCSAFFDDFFPRAHIRRNGGICLDSRIDIVRDVGARTSSPHRTPQSRQKVIAQKRPPLRRPQFCLSGRLFDKTGGLEDLVGAASRYHSEAGYGSSAPQLVEPARCGLLTLRDLPFSVFYMRRVSSSSSVLLRKR